jgi:membrane-associated protein
VNYFVGLGGTAAVLLLCALLFIDESGVPMPFAPNELLLLFAGLLIGNGTVEWRLFLPLGYLCMVGGMLTGYSWARAIGSDRLRAVAERVGAEKTYDRALERVRRSGPLSIGVARMLPGIRTYSTLVAGASEHKVEVFLMGALPALALWLVIFTGLGFAVGAPAQHLLTEFESLAVSGVVMIICGTAAVLAIRRIPPRDLAHPEEDVLLSAPGWERFVLALAVDIGIVTVLVLGVDQLTRSILQSRRLNGPVDGAVVIAAVIVAYVTATRRGAGTTAGEGLFAVSYRARRSA